MKKFKQLVLEQEQNVIPENDQKWDEVFKNFKESVGRISEQNEGIFRVILKYMKENYKAPEKK